MVTIPSSPAVDAPRVRSVTLILTGH